MRGDAERFKTGVMLDIAARKSAACPWPDRQGDKNPAGDVLIMSGEWNFRISNDLIELRNLVVVGSLIIASALARRESRGLHYTLDFPELDASAAPTDTVLTPPGFDVG